MIEGAPDSEIARVYRQLARAIVVGAKPKIPEPLSDERLRELSEI
ncbi:MAG: hypothetical protein QUS09_10335 [Methanotrichaceae archaeon]|nr:hypothetical protein [Methanotrichaceae archaeon]